MSFWNNFALAQDKCDFSVEIHDADWDANWSSLVSKQTTRLEVNLVKRTLTFHLRQTAKGVIQEVIFHALTHGKIDHILVRPAKNPDGYEYHFKNGLGGKDCCYIGEFEVYKSSLSKVLVTNSPAKMNHRGRWMFPSGHQ